MSSSDSWSQDNFSELEYQSSDFTDDTIWTQPQYIQMSDVDLTPTVHPPLVSPFSPSAFPPPLPVFNPNKTQDSIPIGYASNEWAATEYQIVDWQYTTKPPPVEDDIFAGLGEDKVEDKSSKKKRNDSVSLDNLWYHSGTDISKVKPTKKDRERAERKKGLASIKSAPDCFVCGSQMKFTPKKEMGGIFRCHVCYVPQ